MTWMSILVHAAAPRPAGRSPAKARKRLAVPRLGRDPAPRVSLPPAAETPDWTPPTLALLDNLTPLERGVVEWKASGCSSAEAYRRASGRDSASARQAGHQILARPRVAAALAAALSDRNVGARVDREWMLSKLFATICEAQDLHTPAGMRVLVSALNLVARLKGEVGPGRAARPTEAQTAHRADVARRIDQLVAEAIRPQPRPAVVGPLVAAPSATPSPGETPPAATATPAEPPPPPEDGLPIGVVRAFGGEIRIPRNEAVVPPLSDVGPTGPVLPRVFSDPIRYRGASPYFMGTWQ